MAEHAGTLHELLKAQRQELIERWGRRIRTVVATQPMTAAELLDHIPRFVDDLLAVLHPEALPLPGVSENAVEHGAQRLRLGFDVAEVVREYGILHQCILQLAAEAGVVVAPNEHQVLARWLNGGIAVAVTQYVAERDVELQRQAAAHLGFIAHEVRNPLSAARLALASLRRRELAAGGTVLVERLERNLRRTADVVDSTLTHSWLKLGVPLRPEPLELAPFLEEIRTDADGEAQAKGVRVELAVEPALALEADPRLLRSAVTNLLLNAIKFSHPSGQVALSARRDGGRVLIDIEDSCGGLPSGKTQELFAPLVQRGTDRSGFGLGLAIALQAAEAHGGTIRVEDHPGNGCLFTIDVPDGH
jgi:signal transduction histidine kinase